jgi:hypothetical protein
VIDYNYTKPRRRRAFAAPVDQAAAATGAVQTRMAREAAYAARPFTGSINLNHPARPALGTRPRVILRGGQSVKLTGHGAVLIPNS